MLFNAARTHRVPAYRTIIEQSGRVLAAWSVIVTAIAVGIFLFKAHDSLSRVWLVSALRGEVNATLAAT